MSDVIQQEVVFEAPPSRVYEALMDAEQHAAFTGGPAEISRDEGGSFSCHGGAIVGRNVELVPNRRIVQAWRVKDWEPGVYSLVRFEMAADGERTRLRLTHSGAPDGTTEHLAAGWKARYWEPLEKHLE